MMIVGMLVFALAMAEDPYVLLSETKMIKFDYDSMTSGFKWRPVRQMECHGELCREWQSEAAWCANQGFKENRFHWLCVAKFDDPRFKFGDCVVECEGYGIGTAYESYLPGSCQLRYDLKKVSDEKTLTFLLWLWVEFCTALIFSIGVFVVILFVGTYIMSDTDD